MSGGKVGWEGSRVGSSNLVFQGGSDILDGHKTKPEGDTSG